MRDSCLGREIRRRKRCCLIAGLSRIKAALDENHTDNTQVEVLQQSEHMANYDAALNAAKSDVEVTCASSPDACMGSLGLSLTLGPIFPQLAVPVPRGSRALHGRRAPGGVPRGAARPPQRGAQGAG